MHRNEKTLFSRASPHVCHSRSRMRNGRQNAVGNTRAPQRHRNAQPLRPFAYRTQKRNDEPSRKIIVVSAIPKKVEREK